LTFHSRGDQAKKRDVREKGKKEGNLDEKERLVKEGVSKARGDETERGSGRLAQRKFILLLSGGGAGPGHE